MTENDLSGGTEDIPHKVWKYYPFQLTAGANGNLENTISWWPTISGLAFITEVLLFLQKIEEEYWEV